MKRLSRLLATAVVSFGFAFTALDAAAVQALAAPETDQTLTVGGDTISGVRTPGPGSFSEYFYFTASSVPAQVGQVISSIELSGILDISALSLSWIAGHDNIGVGFSSLISNANAPFTNLTSGFALAGPGQTFTLQVSGNATGASGGLYAMSVSAVPEPYEWAMMLAGLGMVGAIASRRRRLATAA